MEVFKTKLTALLKCIALLPLLIFSAVVLYAQPKAEGNGGNTSDSLINTKESLQKEIAGYRRSGDWQALATALTRLAYVSYCLRMENECIRSYHELLSVVGIQKDGRLMARACVDLGTALRDFGKYDSSMFYSFKALSLGETLKNDSIVCVASTCLGSIYNFKKNYPKSLELYSKALTYAVRMKDNVPLYVTCLGNKALAFSWLNMPDSAIRLELEALPLAERLKNYKYVSTLKMNLASNYAALHQYNKANEYLDNLVQELPAYRLKPGDECMKKVVIGIIYWDMRNISKATFFLHQQLPVAARLNNQNLLQRIYDTLGVIAETQKQYPAALRYFKLSQQYKDSINAGENSKMVSELEIKYQTAQKERALSEKQLQLVQKDAQIQQNRHYLYLILSSMALLILGILLLFYNYRNRRKEHIRELRFIEQQKEYQLLQALMQGEEKERSRIARDLHDSMSGMLAAAKMHLHSLSLKLPAITKMDGYTQSVELLNEVAADVRKTSHHLMPEVLRELGLDDALRRYCLQMSNSELLQIQYDSFGIIKRYKDSFELSVYRMVQELLNNIVRHSHATKVMVQLSVQEQLRSIAVEDNGKGISVEESNHGTGLHHLKAKVKALNGMMELYSQPDCGLQVYLEFDVKDMECGERNT